MKSYEDYKELIDQAYMDALHNTYNEDYEKGADKRSRLNALYAIHIAIEASKDSSYRSMCSAGYDVGNYIYNYCDLSSMELRKQVLTGLDFMVHLIEDDTKFF